MHGKQAPPVAFGSFAQGHLLFGAHTYTQRARGTPFGPDGWLPLRPARRLHPHPRPTGRVRLVGLCPLVLGQQEISRQRGWVSGEGAGFAQDPRGPIRRARAGWWGRRPPQPGPPASPTCWWQVGGWGRSVFAERVARAERPRRLPTVGSLWEGAQPAHCSGRVSLISCGRGPEAPRSPPARRRRT